ncbi:helicase C-terminal domain-containing protein [uncultured Parasphingorhabdus sp.]|uniref:helicase C-terminal domain-containing protein n=1 Tax=uncultured Parasphingorhabdus sp. TaxID=2709694 RepID=UPI0030D8FFAD
MRYIYEHQTCDQTGGGQALTEILFVRRLFRALPNISTLVLATTSVGQEGLDFHFYWHRLVDRNLPNNPIDLEQREGRVHRFKNHATRMNVSEQEAFLGTIRVNRVPATGAASGSRSRQCSDGQSKLAELRAMWPHFVITRHT